MSNHASFQWLHYDTWSKNLHFEHRLRLRLCPIQSNRKFNCTTHVHCMVFWALFVNGQVLFHENCSNHMPYVRHRFQTPKSVLTNWVFFLRSLLIGLIYLFILSKLGTLFPPQCIPHARTILFGRQSCPCPLVTFISNFTIISSQWTRGGWYTTTTCIPYFCIECVVAWKQSLNIDEHQNAYL